MSAQPSPPPGPGVSGFGTSSSRRNWQAIASLVGGLTCLGLPGIVFGHLALRSVLRGEATNRGIAIAGLVLSYLNVALVTAFFVFGSGLNAQSAPGGAGTSGLRPTGAYAPEPVPSVSGGAPGRRLDTDLDSSAAWFGLSVGDCIADYHNTVGRQGDNLVFSGFTVLPCEQGHYGEVYAIAEVSGDVPPSDEEAWAYLRAACAGEPFAAYVGAAYGISEYSYDWLYPADSWWYDGNHQFICLAVHPNGSVEGTVQGAGT